MTVSEFWSRLKRARASLTALLSDRPRLAYIARNIGTFALGVFLANLVYMVGEYIEVALQNYVTYGVFVARGTASELLLFSRRIYIVFPFDREGVIAGLMASLALTKFGGRTLSLRLARTVFASVLTLMFFDIAYFAQPDEKFFEPTLEGFITSLMADGAIGIGVGFSVLMTHEGLTWLLDIGPTNREADNSGRPKIGDPRMRTGRAARRWLWILLAGVLAYLPTFLADDLLGRVGWGIASFFFLLAAFHQVGLLRGGGNDPVPSPTTDGDLGPSSSEDQRT
jgi:hypothetical protein